MPIVAPEESGWCENFSERYKNLCESVNVELAENCPKNEKAFENQKRGKVSGILFDSTDLSWAIPVSSVADPDPEPEPDPGSETFDRIRIRSGTEINVLDPDSNPDSNPDPKPDSNPEPK